MTQQIINLGTADKGNGDVLRTAFGKVNANFAELYTLTGDDIQIPAQATHTGKVLTTNGTTLSWGTVSYTSLTDKPTIPTSFSSLVNGAYTTSLGANGVLTLPAGGAIAESTNTFNIIGLTPVGPTGVPSSISGGVASTNAFWDQNPLSNLATTLGSGTGLTVTVTQTEGVAIAIAIVNPGTGYTNGELISVTSGIANAMFYINTVDYNETEWTFGCTGALTFPDATVQTTAYQKVAVPVHSYGVAGDKTGMIAFDVTYIYYCTADYANDTTDIWKRTAHGAGTW